jgi:hypothetical protein
MRKVMTILVICIVAFAGLNGCATTANPVHAAVESVQGPISIALLSEKDVKNSFGWSLLDNPYLAYKGTLVGTANDYLVFRLTVNAEAETQLEMSSAGAEDEKGKVKAPFCDVDSFKRLTMATVENQTNTGSFSVRENKVTWYYLPSGSVDVKPGKHSYIFVLVGRHPLPDSLTAHIQLLVNGEEMDFELGIPDQE